MPNVSEPRIPEVAFLFRIEVEGVGSAEFQDAGPFSAETGDIEYNQGNSAIPLPIPGKTKFPDVTLSRGMTSDVDLYNLFSKVYDAVAGIGEVDPKFRFNFDAVPLKRDGTEAMRWRCTFCYIKSYVGPSFDATSENVTIEQVVIRLHRMFRVQ